MSLPLTRRPLPPWEGTVPDAAAAVPPLEALAGAVLDRCRGEGPPNCQARCPLGVDARRYVQLAREGRFDEALQVVRERLPFPGILGYVCAHPCELHCKRIDEDSPVRIRDIKRFLAEREQGQPRHIVDRLPSSGHRVAVVGAGPAGLIAAHDLARRGHAVTIFEKEDTLGGCLVQRIPAWRLPRSVVERDLSIVEALGIEVRTGVEVGRDIDLAEIRNDFGTVLLFAGFHGGQSLLRRGLGGLRRTVRGTVWADPDTCETSEPGIFAGGDSVSGPATVIDALALGRRAAESARRSLEGLDVRAGRRPALPPRLLWQLEVGEDERRRRQRPPTMMEPANAGLTEEEVLEEAGRCLDCQCGLCVKDCEFLAQHCSSPKSLAREVLADPRASLKMVYSCNVCSLCAAVCPEGLDTGALLLEARRAAVAAGIGPLPQHKPIVSYYRAGVSKTFTLVRPEPGRQKSRRLFFTGCALPAVSPRNTLALYDALRRHLPSTGVLMQCCGAPVELLGMDEEFERCREQLLRAADSAGAEELLAACPDCLHTLKSRVPEIKVRSVWEVLAGVWEPPALAAGARVAVHDSCKAHHEPDTMAGIRTLIAAAGAEVDEIEYNGALARCCGNGGMMYPVDPALSQRVTDRRAADSPLPMVTYCAGCRMALASRGKPAVHVLDLLLADDWEQRARSKPTGGLARYANRLRTKFAFRRLRPLKAE